MKNLVKLCVRKSTFLQVSIYHNIFCIYNFCICTAFCRLPDSLTNLHTSLAVGAMDLFSTLFSPIHAFCQTVALTYILPLSFLVFHFSLSTVQGMLALYCELIAETILAVMIKQKIVKQGNNCSLYAYRYATIDP